MNGLTKSEILDILSYGTEEKMQNLFNLLSKQRDDNIAVLHYIDNIHSVVSKAYIKFADEIFRGKYPDILTTIDPNSDETENTSTPIKVNSILDYYNDKIITTDKIFWGKFTDDEGDEMIILLQSFNPKTYIYEFYGSFNQMNLKIVIIDQNVGNYLEKINRRIENDIHMENVIKDHITDSWFSKENQLIYTKEILKEISDLNSSGLQKILEYVKDLKQNSYYKK